MAPFTPGYLSPQACLFDSRLARNRNSYYPPSPADDLYALGVTAYRLVMRQYPPDMEVQKDEQDSWQVTNPDPRPLLESNPRVEARLREVTLRLLSDSPEARGTAAQAAEALEVATEESMLQQTAEPRPAAEVPPLVRVLPERRSERPEHVRPHARSWTWMPWLARRP